MRSRSTTQRLLADVDRPILAPWASIGGSGRARVIEYALDERLIVNSCGRSRAREVFTSREGRVRIGLDEHQFAGGRQPEVETSGAFDSQQRVHTAGEFGEFLFDGGRQWGSRAVTDAPLCAIRIVPFRAERRK